MQASQRKFYRPYISPFDPCPPIKVKSYETPPHLYMCFQPPGLPQFEAHQALRRGTLWPALYSGYKSPYKMRGGIGQDESESPS